MSKAYKPLPAAEELWELFSYNPLTGNLHWRIKPNRSICIDDPLGTDRPDYIYGSVNKIRYVAHRLIWTWFKGTDPVVEIDHRDEDRKNNRIWNLRRASKAQNCWNKSTPKTNTSGFKNVYLYRGKWKARIRKEGKRIYLGTFDTPEKAYQAFCEAAKRLHGDFAKLG